MGAQYRSQALSETLVSRRLCYQQEWPAIPRDIYRVGCHHWIKLTVVLILEIEVTLPGIQRSA